MLGVYQYIAGNLSIIKTHSLAKMIGILEKNNLFLLGRGRGSFLDASNKPSFSAGTEGQLNDLSLDTCTEEALEKNKYLQSWDVADINQDV